MLIRRLTGVFIADIKYIGRTPRLLIALLFPVVIIILHLFACSYISGLYDAEKALQYYTVIAVSLISAVPFIYGIVFSFIQLHGKQFADLAESVQRESDKRDLYLIRLIISGLLAFITVLPVIYITDAVRTEGWLRSIYVSFLLAAMAPFIFASSTGSGDSIGRWRMSSLISVIFILPVPFGLMLHHPWNYLAFFSPFYWINWAWIIPSPGESLIYGLISMVISGAGLIFLYMRYSRSVIR